jgi:hypothetical protein
MRFSYKNIGAKSERKMFMKLTIGVNFTNMFMSSFYSRRSQQRKNSVKLSVSFGTFGIWAIQSYGKNVNEIDPRCLEPNNAFKKG